MELKFNVDTPANFSQNQRNEFLKLLIEQDQVDNPSMGKINNCRFLCIVSYNGIAIGIGAIKQGTKSAFRKSGMQTLEVRFNNELGYVFARNEQPYCDFGIGKTISRLLLKEVGNENVFASTEVGESKSTMKHILVSLGFNHVGRTYKGQKTGKILGMYVKECGS